MQSNQADRRSKRRVESPAANPDGAPELDPAQIERIEEMVEKVAAATLHAAFDRFFEAWFDRVYAFAWRVAGDKAYAETLTTLVFMKALHLLPRSSSGARELAQRLASARPRRPGRENGDPRGTAPRRAGIDPHRGGPTS